MATATLFFPVAASALANIFFGMTVVATRYLVVDTDPITLAFLRNLIAAITLLPLLAGAAGRRLDSKDILPIAGLGAAQFGVFPLTFTTSLSLTNASRGALVFALVPIMTLIFASTLRIERFTRLKLAGALLALCGVLLALGQGVLDPGNAGSLAGELFMFLTVFIGASYNTLSRPFLSRYPARLLTVYFMAAGVLLLAPFALASIASSGLPNFTLWQWTLVLFTGTFGGSIGYFLFIWALAKGTPARVAMLVPLNPVTATVLGAALLQESLTSAFLVGLACVVVGILLVNVGPHSDALAPSLPKDSA